MSDKKITLEKAKDLKRTASADKNMRADDEGPGTATAGVRGKGIREKELSRLSGSRLQTGNIHASDDDDEGPGTATAGVRGKGVRDKELSRQAEKLELKNKPTIAERLKKTDPRGRK